MSFQMFGRDGAHELKKKNQKLTHSTFSIFYHTYNKYQKYQKSIVALATLR